MKRGAFLFIAVCIGLATACAAVPDPVFVDDDASVNGTDAAIATADGTVASEDSGPSATVDAGDDTSAPPAPATDAQPPNGPDGCAAAPGDVCCGSHVCQGCTTCTVCEALCNQPGKTLCCVDDKAMLSCKNTGGNCGGPG